MNAPKPKGCAAIVLAAGKSQRMGSPKMLLPWGSKTVIERVISTLTGCGIVQVIVVAGQYFELIQEATQDLSCRVIQNSDYTTGEMLSSIQVGLESLPESVPSALIVLGDQPQMQANTIRLILDQWVKSQTELIVPSFQKHKGHPWMIHHNLFSEFTQLRPPSTPHDFINAHIADIHYIDVDNDSILRDLDTPEDYQREKPQ